MSNKKIAPEPPRRHCSIRNSRTLSAYSAQQQQQLQQQQQMGLHVGAAVTPGLYYGGAGALHHGGMYMTHAQQQAAAAAATANQPIYANYATIQQTTAEIHCEKFHDNKVRMHTCEISQSFDFVL